MAEQNSLIERKILFSLHLSFYGPLLTDVQREIAELYANEDQSLSEIASQMKVTRQSVYETILRAEKILLSTESKLGLISRFEFVSKQLNECRKHLEQVDAADAESRAHLEQARQCVMRLSQEEETNGI